MGLTSARFTCFFMTTGVIILGREIDRMVDSLFPKRLSPGVIRRIEHIFMAAAFVSAVGYVGTVNFSLPRFGQAEWFSVPSAGVQFIEKENIKGLIFNDIGSGGYLTWKLYPDSRTFVDTRALNYIAVVEYGFIMNAVYSKYNLERPEGADKGKSELWDRLLDHYGIDVIFLTPLDVYGKAAPLLFKLVDSEKWTPLYNDQLAIIFVRNNKRHEKLIASYRRTSEEVLSTVILQSSVRASNNPMNPIFYISIGDSFFRLKRFDEALKAYNHAYKRRQDPSIQRKIDAVRSEIESAKKI